MVNGKPVEGKIEALRAGREASTTVKDLWRGVPIGALLGAQAGGASVGEEFAATREIRRRERARRAGA